MNKSTASIENTSRAISQLMPNIIRGVQLDFFARRRITQTQFLMLVAVHSYGRCTMTTLAKNLAVQMPTATGIMDRLVRGGYARRSVSSEDRRQVMVELTPKGFEFIRDFQKVIQKRWGQVLRSLEPRELSSFHDVVVKLRLRLGSGE